MTERTFMIVAMPAFCPAGRSCGSTDHVSPHTYSILETGQNAGTIRDLTAVDRGAAEEAM
jgi:hypothetical protein